MNFFLNMWYRNLRNFNIVISLFYFIIIFYCSVRGTIDRYKKACSDSSNTGSVVEANVQVTIHTYVHISTDQFILSFDEKNMMPGFIIYALWDNLSTYFFFL